MTSTSWGSRRESTSWGGRRAAATVTVAVLALTGLPIAPAAGASTAMVVTGPGAVAAARELGATVVSAGLGSAGVAQLTAAQADALRARGLAVVPDAPVRLTATATRATTAGPRLSVAQLTGASGTGLTGAGVTVAVVDSGVEEVAALRGRVVQGPDFTGTGTRDTYGHGTFVAGLVSQVAPDARIVSVKIADGKGDSSVGRLVLGLSWVVANGPALGIDVVNLSVSTGRGASYHASPVNALVEAAWFSGMTVVASAGNEGRRIKAAPANDPWVIVAGSVNDANTVSTLDDRRSPFSNRGTDVVGSFGQHVRSPLPAGSVLASRQTVTGLPSGYGQLSGTSMAAGVLSGIAALLEQARPSITPDQAKGALLAARTGTARVAPARRALAEGTTKIANQGNRPSHALAMAYAQLVAGTTDYAKFDWRTVDWRSVAWSDVTWTDATWTDLARANATWTNATWTNATWTTATWTH